MLTFCQKKRSTLLERKMKPRPRPLFWPTQRPCFRVSSSCTLYEVFGNFAWRSAPPRKRVAQFEKAPDCETERCPLPVAVAVGPACGGTAIGEPPWGRGKFYFCRAMKFPRASLPYEYTIFSDKNVFGQIYFNRWLLGTGSVTIYVGINWTAVQKWYWRK